SSQIVTDASDMRSLRTTLSIADCTRWTSAQASKIVSMASTGFSVRHRLTADGTVRVGHGNPQHSILFRPRRHSLPPIRVIAQMRRRGRAPSRRDRGARLPLVADGVDPVLQVQQLAIRLRVEIATARQLGVENLLLRLHLREPWLRDQLETA